MKQESSFGSFVRQRRREMDLTQEELARRVGCAAITLRKIEADDLRPSVQIAERLAMALGIPLDERAEFVRRARAITPEFSELPTVTPAPSLDEIGREDLTGRAIRGYALAERIGMGGMGSVYRAVQPNVEREVAIKIILPAYANHPDFIRRFEAEAQLVARLEHPHIVPLYDYWREPGVAYLVMRLLRGGNIQSLLGEGPLSIEMVSRVLEQICSALNTAHRIGVIHRDLKPANVMLDEDNNAYLADFGIAKNISNPDRDHQTQIDEIVGTWHYMSPEQINSLSIRPQTDIYCLGIMLYEMLTGALPFSGPTPMDFIQQHTSAPMPPLAARQPGLPILLDQVISRATSKRPEDRYEDTLSLYREFRQAVSGMVETQPIQIQIEEEELSASEIVNPFKGLRSFSEADAENFFGRETFVQQLLARLGEGGDLKRFLAVIGPSGSGKSSVVRAGLVPALKRGGLPGSENWFVVDMLPGKHPFEELEASLLRVAVNPPEHLISQIKDGSRGLLRAVHRILPADLSVELVLVIDQFEEIFTLMEDEAERALLLESLATAILDERSRLRLVITLRADFTDKPLRYVDFGELMNRRFEFILPLTPDELERAILNPTQRVGLKLEKGLASTIIRDTENQPGALPLLQYALSELFEKREGRTLTNKAYKEIGGVLGALGRSAESVYANLDESSRSAARQLFLRLVTLGEGTEDTRRRVLRSELESLTISSDHLTKVIDAFGKARLLSFDRDPITRGATIEVAHEALLREWTRLREWLDESRADLRLERQLATATREWQNAGEDVSFLMTGSRLEQFESWAANTTIALTQDERAFLAFSIAERHKVLEKEKQSVIRLRRLNRVVTTVGSIAVILAILAGLFGLQSNRNAITAQAERDRADESAKISFSRELAAAAISNLDTDPERSILLALQAESTAHTIEAENALHRSILASRVVLTLQHDAFVNNLFYSPDGKHIATANADGTAKIWNTSTGRLLLTLTGHTDEVYGISYSQDGKRVATSSLDTTAKVWDAASGNELLTLTGHIAGVRGIVFSPDGNLLATVSEDMTVKIWDAASGEELHTLTGHDEIVWDAAFSPDGKLIASSGSDGNVRIWDVSSGKELNILPFEGFPTVYSVTFSPDGKYIAAAGGGTNSGMAVVWDAATGKVILSGSFGHTNQINYIAFSPDGTLMATVADDQKVKIWDNTTGQVYYTLSGHNSTVSGVDFSPDGEHLATASWDGTARVWDLTPPKEALFIPFADTTISSWSMFVNYSPDGKHILSDYTDGNARIWDALSGKELLQLNGPALYTTYSLDGKLAASGNYDTTIIVWDTQTGEQLKTLSGHTDIVLQSVFSPDGARLASASIDGTVIIWDLASGNALLTLKGDSDYQTSVAYSPDGKFLVAGGGDFNTINNGIGIIWNAITGERIFTLPSDSLISAVAYSLDGKLAIIGSFNGAIHIWDAITGKHVSILKGHTGVVNSAAFSPDGTQLATSSLDGTARIWDVTSGVNVLTLPVDSGGTGSVVFDPDGRHLAVGRASGISIFYLHIEDLIALAKTRVTRTLTLEECQQYLHMDACPAMP